MQPEHVAPPLSSRYPPPAPKGDRPVRAHPREPTSTNSLNSITQFWSRTSGVNRVPAASLTEQIQTARKYLPDFGIAAPCGFGRAPARPGRLLTDKGSEAPPNYLDAILNDHMAGVDILHEVMPH